MKIIDLYMLTSMEPLLKYVKENEDKYSIFIYLTDGYMSPPRITTRVPVVIVVTKTGADPDEMKKQGFPGKIIKMNDEC